MSSPVATRPVQFQVTFNDSAGNPVSGETYAFSYRLSNTGPSGPFTPAGTGVTNVSGIATLATPILLPVPNTYDADAVFSGDGNYDPSTGTVRSFQIKAGSKSTLVLLPQ